MPDTSPEDRSAPESPARRSGMRLARGASPWLLPTAVTAAGLGTAALRSRRWAVPAVPALALTAAMLWFFRDPERTPDRPAPHGPSGAAADTAADTASGGSSAATGRLLAGADGTVQSIDPWPDGRTRIATFMSPLNVHVNRAPVTGTITSVEHVAGGYLPAFNKDSDRNERVVWHFDTEHGDIELVQIAGAVARRIVPYLEEGAKVESGERIGLIRLGSRVDVYLPAGMNPGVEVGQRLIAGESYLDRH